MGFQKEIIRGGFLHPDGGTGVRKENGLIYLDKFDDGS
jgi:hypothetical protein